MALSSPKARELEQETEIIPAIRHEDAEWKVIQQNTFTRWVNNHLKKANSSIQSLETDFSDGLKLIDLAMVLSQKNLGKFNKKVNFRSQKMENVTLALNFFQEVEKIKIINIDSSHIVDKNKKLILGLIWTLILHYSISMGWIVEKREGQPDETPKQKLLNWVRGHLPGGMPVTNFTSDWNDGIALGALVNSMAPGSCPSWSEWTPDNALANTEKAIEEAKERLGIEPLIAPAELIHPEIDEMSVMTYLSQFPAAKPIQVPPKPLPSPAPVPIVSGEFRGIDRDPIVHQPFEFDVAIVGDGYKPKVSVVDLEGKPIHHTVSKKDAHNFSVKCTPVTLGDHSLGLQLIDVISGETTPVPSADASFHVLPAPRLRDYPERVKIGEEVKLTVENAFKGPVDVFVVDGDGGEEKLVVTESAEPGVHCTEYTPKVKGLHSINVFHRKNQIENSPFALRVSDNTPESLLVWGRGICEDGIRSGDPVPIHVRSLNDDDVLHQDDVKLNIKHKDSGNVLPVFPLTHHNKDVSFHYTPISEGDYEIDVQYKDKPIGKSPYKVTVSPSTSSEVRAFGPGLEGGVADETSVFEVLTNGKADRLAFSIEGPSETEITCQSKDHGTALVAYKPSVPGVYKVNVLAAGDHIQDSPFVFMVDPKEENFHPAAARVHDLNGNDIHLAREPVVFNIDTKLAESHDVPKVVVLDSKMNKLPVDVTEKTPGFYEAKFVPEKAGIFHVDASLKNVALPGAPFSIAVKEPVDVSKLYMYGPGIDGPVTSQEPTHFTIDAKQAGPGTVEVSLEDRAGKSVDIDVLDNQDGSFTVKYTAPRPGAYELNVIFAGEKIPPIEINVRPHVDISGVRVEGLENAIVTVNCEKDFHVFTTDGDNTRIIITSPSGEVVEAFIESTPNGLRVRFTPSEIGDYKIDVTYKDIPIPQSPVNIHSVDGASSSNVAEAEYVVSRSGPARPDLVVVSGPGLGPVFVKYSTSVIIDTRLAGFGDIDLFVDGPTRTPIHCVDNQDGTLTMHYVPKVPGIYFLRVMFDDEHIPGSPFQVVAVPPMMSSPLLHPDRESTESSFSGSSSQRTTPVV